MSGKARMTEKEAIARGIIPPPDPKVAIPPLRDWVLAQPPVPAPKPKRTGLMRTAEFVSILVLALVVWLMGLVCGLLMH